MTMSRTEKVYKACVASIMVAALAFGLSAKLSGWDAANDNLAVYWAR